MIKPMHEAEWRELTGVVKQAPSERLRAILTHITSASGGAPVVVDEGVVQLVVTPAVATMSVARIFARVLHLVSLGWTIFGLGAVAGVINSVRQANAARHSTAGMIGMAIGFGLLSFIPVAGLEVIALVATALAGRADRETAAQECRIAGLIAVALGLLALGLGGYAVIASLL